MSVPFGTGQNCLLKSTVISDKMQQLLQTLPGYTENNSDTDDEDGKPVLVNT